MISNYDVENWLQNFDEPIKATMQYVLGIESWTCDDEEKVQEALNMISGVAQTTSKDNPLLFQEIVDEGRSTALRTAFTQISEQEVIELQAQLIFPRAIKLFGDLVNLEPEVAKKLISTELLQSNDEAVVIGARTLVSRILFLSKMSIFQRIFSDRNQYQFVMEAIENYEF